MVFTKFKSLIIIIHYYYCESFICGALRDLVPFLPCKKREKDPWWSVTFSKVVKPATLLKVIFLHGCLSRFLNCPQGTKSCNARLFMLSGNQISFFKPIFTKLCENLFV